MKLSFKFSLKTIPALAKKHIQALLWLFLIVIMAMEFFVIKSSLDLILAARATAPGAQAQIIRVNFEQYKLIEKRLDDNNQYSPNPIKYTSPFGQQQQ